MSSKVVSYVIGSLTIAGILDLLGRYYFKKKPFAAIEKHTEINEVIMFSYSRTTVKKSKYSRCLITPSLDRVFFHLYTTRHTLDICMYVLTNLDIANVLIKLRNTGVVIRLIVDADMAYATGSYVHRLEKIGVIVRWTKSENLMHHKFCLIDASADRIARSSNCQTIPMVMTGSLNWTSQALSGNWEDVLVTSQPDIVAGFKAEFERLWVEFKPIV